MLRFIRRLIVARRGAAAVEFALILPLLVVMLFFFWEYGRFVEGTHAVSKAARDGVRFAARKEWQKFEDICGPSIKGDDFDREEIRLHVVRSLASWGATTANVDVMEPGDPRTRCVPIDTGIFALPEAAQGAPIVWVEVDVPYNSLFSGITGALGLRLRGYAESAVMGA